MDKDKRRTKKTWFDYRKFYDMIACEGFGRLCEVGVWEGESISHLARQCRITNRNAHIWAVDLFEDTYRYHHLPKLQERAEKVSETFRANLAAAGVTDMITPVKGYSWECAKQFKDGFFDFVFIDADHSYESVCKDIDAWLPKVRPGGIIAGHDYDNPHHPGVREAVDEAFKDVSTEEGTVWWAKL